MTHCEGSTHRSADWTPLAKRAAVDCFIKLQQWPIKCERKRVTESERVYIYSGEPDDLKEIDIQMEKSRQFYFFMKFSLDHCMMTKMWATLARNKFWILHIFVFVTQTPQRPSPVHPKSLHTAVTDGVVLLFWCISSLDRIWSLTRSYCWAQKITS